MIHKFISHRGNTRGPVLNKENHPDWIDQALELGFDVEVDVWLQSNGILALGHDFPQHIIKANYLKNDRIWAHAKNFKALQFMLDEGIHCFWHQEDDYTLTSKQYIWVYPNANLMLNNNSIAVTPERTYGKWYLHNVYGICSDYIEDYYNEYGDK